MAYADGFKTNCYLVSKPLPQLVLGDQVRLKQVLINLVKNAFKFTKRGKIRIIAAYDELNEMLTVHVVDTGKGIKDEEMDHLFQMFGKLLRTSDMNSEGIGMGLMICQNLVRMNKGQISTKSEGENKGSIFTFTFNLKRVMKNRDIL